MTDLLVGRLPNWIKYALASVPMTTPRDGLVLGAYQPDATTTGVFPGVPRITVTSTAGMPGGALTPGTTYQNLNIQFMMTPPTGTAPIVFRNCNFQGPAVWPTGSVALARCFTTGHCPVEFYDCTFRAQTPNPSVNGLMGHDYKAVRCDVSGVVDAVSVFNTADPAGPVGVSVTQSSLHDLLWYPNPQDSHPDGSHNDGVQMQGGAGFVFQGNNVQAFTDPSFFNSFYSDNKGNTCMLVKPDVGQITGLDVRFNWFAGGRSAGIIINHDSPTTILGNIGVINSNWFVRDTSASGLEILRPTSVPITCDFGTGATQNFFTDDPTKAGPAVPLSNGG